MKLLSWLIILLLVVSCEQSTEKAQQTDLEKAVHQLKLDGYGTDDYSIYDENHIIIENDILIDIHDLLNPKSRDKQYRTSTLLSDNQVRNIRIYITSGVSSNWRSAVGNAMSTWNNVSGTKVNFTYGSSSSYDVRVVMESVQQGFLAFAEFPLSSGRAGSKVTLGSAFANNNVSYLARVVVHEFGHTLGFRHTNWFDRNSDGNQSDNEGQGSMGAVHIPGTSSSYDSSSIMNASIGQSNGNFTNGDLVSIRYMYPDGGGTDPDPDNGTIEVDGPSSVNSGASVEYSLNNGQSANWWIKYNGGSWQNIGNNVSVSGTVSNSFTLAAGYNNTYYYKSVTVY